MGRSTLPRESALSSPSAPGASLFTLRASRRGRWAPKRRPLPSDAVHTGYGRPLQGHGPRADHARLARMMAGRGFWRINSLFCVPLTAPSPGRPLAPAPSGPSWSSLCSHAQFRHMVRGGAVSYSLILPTCSYIHVVHRLACVCDRLRL